MNYEDKFIDYIEDTLQGEERKEFEAALENSTDLKAAFDSYKKVLEAEKALAGEAYSLSPNFSVKVMEQIEQDGAGFIKRIQMGFIEKSRRALTPVATVAVLLICLKLGTESGDQIYQPEVSSKDTREITQVEEANSKESDSFSASKEDEKKNVDSNNISDLDESALTLGLIVSEKTKRREGSFAGDKENAPNELSRSKSELAGSALKNEKKVPTKTNQIALNSQVQQPAVGRNRGAAKTQNLQGLKNSGSSLSIVTNSKVPSPGAGLGASAEEGVRLDAVGISVSQEVIVGDFEKARAQAEQKANDALREFRKSQRLGIPSTQQEILEKAYQGYQENYRTRTDVEAISTFGVDVDTASYSNARRYLERGTLPPKDAVRIEEFINYFSYNYPTQTDKPFSLSYEIGKSPLEQDRYILKLGIKARDTVHEEKPWNLVFLVDVSGSMSGGDRLGLVQKGLRLLTNKMRDGDKISIVTYAGNARKVLEPTGKSEASKILTAIDNLRAGGGTNGSSGIQMAYEAALAAKLSNGINRVIVATDGDFNVGVTSRNALIQMIEEKRRSGIFLTTIGVGAGNIKDATLEQLADKGNGNYFYLDGFKEARKVFETELGGTIDTVAKDVKLQVEFNPQHVASYRLIGYENRKLAKEDFSNDKIDSGEIGSSHTVTALYEIVLAGSELAKKLDTEYRYQKKPATKKPVLNEGLSNELGFLKIRYKEPTADNSKLLRFPLLRSELKDGEASEDFRFAAAVSYFGHLLRGSAYTGSYSFADIAKLAASATGKDSEGHRHEFVQLVKTAGSIK